ncbi:MAG TPA: HAMP domain-containing sensor histidine kinase [Vicinamibacterales bacterium]|nr:HAMP domain-containing sensor histidine kinase [Vicinamibacterales bacterium]
MRFRLAWWYALIFVASSAMIVALTYFLLASALRQYDHQIIQTTLVEFATAYARGGVPGLSREIQRTQSSGAAGPLFVRVGGRQNVVFLSMPEGWRGFDLSQLSEPGLTGEQSWATLDTGVPGAEVLEVASVRLGDGTLFQVGRSTARRTELLSRFRRLLLFDAATIILVGLVGGAMLTWSAMQPVRALTETVRGIMQTGRTSARVPVQEPGDALGDLSALVNAMLDRIDAVVSGMRGALDNVAHDLRTPMARLRGTAESALASQDPEVLRGALADCLEESDRIMAMLSTLMDISEAETGTMAIRLEPTDIPGLVQQTVELYEDLAEEHGLKIRVDIPADLVVPLDRNRMRQVLANLLDNAVKYTPSGGSIDINARSDDGWVLIAVADTGVGIAADELPHIWDRLYRGDKSRSTRGLGLGLSLVRAIVEAHGGQVHAASTPGAGSRFELRLPTAPPNISRL